MINMEREIKKLSLEKDEDWDEHVEQFHILVSKLESYKKTLSEEEKKNKIKIFLILFCR